MCDLHITGGGTVYLVHALTDAGRAWIEENVCLDDAQYLGDGLAVEHRYIADIVRGATADGLSVS